MWIFTEPPDVLEQWVLELFRGLPGPPKSANKKKKRKHSTLEHWQLELPKSFHCLWTPGEQYFVEAPDDNDILEISWALPSLRRIYQYKSKGYVSYLLNQSKRIYHDSLEILPSFLPLLNSKLTTQHVLYI
jgi:secreted Zn-dependent insulinase-like peptidase